LTAIKTGKGISLAFFLIFICLPVFGSDFPVIRQLSPIDTMFTQFMNDIEGNRRRVAGVRALTPEQIAEHLTIYRYTVREADDFISLAARLNIPHSALASINRLNNPQALEPGMILLLPSCPGIYIPENIITDLEKILGASRESDERSVELRLRMGNHTLNYLFFPGADFTHTERAFFLNSGFRFPLRQYRITSRFGLRADPFTGNRQVHRGIDLAAPEGTEVFAVANGTVSSTGFDPVYGNYIIISHNNNYSSLYGHLQTIYAVLRSDVNSGSLIGRVGSTGQSTGPHLHFELRRGGIPIDPNGRLRP